MRRVSAPNRFSAWFNGQLTEWDITDQQSVPFIDLRYFSDVFRVVDEALPDAGLHILATDALVGPLPVSACDLVVLCLNDESGKCPTYAFDVGLVVKTMGGAKRLPYVALWPAHRWPAALPAALEELQAQLGRAPYSFRALLGTLRHRHRPPVLDTPLGIRAYFGRELVPFDAREHDVMFAGSLVNEPGEEARWLPAQKWRARRAFLAAVDDARRARPDLAFSIRTVPSHWTAVRWTKQYLDEMVQSRIVLCPRGSSLDTHRFFEALRFGCVPVYEMLPNRTYYRGSPGVRCADWRRLPEVLDRLFADPAELRERHHAALRWYEEHVAPPAVGTSIARAISRATGSAHR